MPVASVIMCGYNSEKYLSRSIGSILNQTYPEIELVFMDDGSQDHTYDVALSYQHDFEQKGYQLKVFRQENQGPGYASINALQYATGAYLSFLDSDDALLPDSIEKRVKALEVNQDVNIVRTNGYRVYEKSSKAKELIVKENQEKTTNRIFEDIIIGTANNFAGTFMIRANALKTFYGAEPIPYSDYGQNLQLILAGAYHSKQIFIDEPLMEYFIYPNTHSHKKTMEDSISMYEGWYNLRKEIVEKFARDKKDCLTPSRILSVKNILDCILSQQEPIQYICLFDKYYSELVKLHGNSLELKMYHSQLHGSWNALLYRVLFFLQRKLK